VASGLEAIFQQGAAALDADDLQGAEQIFRRIVEANPRAHPAWNALSVVAVRSGLPDLAVEHAHQALALDRRNPVYLNSLGVAYGERGSLAEAEDAFRRALKARPVYAEGMFNLGKVLHKLYRLADAARAFERAYAMQPAFPGLVPALVAVYRKLGRADRALALLEARPAGLSDDDSANIWPACLAEVQSVDAAIAWLHAELARHPGRHALRFSLGVLLLGQARWSEGWRHYLWRPNLRGERSAEGALPPVLPARLDGSRILLRGEQGMGDVLFFLRFASKLRERGARITLACEPRLAAFVAPQEPLEAVREASEEDATAPQFDFRLWCGDLPALLGADAVAPAWPLAAGESEVARARARLAAFGQPPYLGVTWRAGTDILRRREFGNERNLLMKELPPAGLGAAVQAWPGTLLSLQRGARPEEVAAFTGAARKPLHDVSPVSDDLGALLATLSLLDDYACVSNTNVHLLAGLGRTARVLVPYPPEWRWMHAGDSPWFPGFKVYREPQTRGWEQPLQQLRNDLPG
jgi:Flp pilus assembly protein TadD